MGCFVYVLGTRTETRHLTYVGWTSDVARRLAQHNSGKGARATRGRTWVLLHSEWYQSLWPEVQLTSTAVTAFGNSARARY